GEYGELETSYARWGGMEGANEQGGDKENLVAKLGDRGA
ncbi:hypothetical protein Tco_0657964, partial [Tanacetum coccineum]